MSQATKHGFSGSMFTQCHNPSVWRCSFTTHLWQLILGMVFRWFRVYKWVYHISWVNHSFLAGRVFHFGGWDRRWRLGSSGISQWSGHQKTEGPDHWLSMLVKFDPCCSTLMLLMFVCRDWLPGWVDSNTVDCELYLGWSQVTKTFRGETSNQLRPMLAQVLLLLPWHKRRKAAVAVAVTATAAAIAVMMRSTLEWAQRSGACDKVFGRRRCLGPTDVGFQPKSREADTKSSTGCINIYI